MDKWLDNNGYAASGIQKYYSSYKLDFPKRHAGGGPETKDILHPLKTQQGCQTCRYG